MSKRNPPHFIRVLGARRMIDINNIENNKTNKFGNCVTYVINDFNQIIHIILLDIKENDYLISCTDNPSYLFQIRTMLRVGFINAPKPNYWNKTYEALELQKNLNME